MGYGTRIAVQRRWQDVVGQVTDALAEHDLVVLSRLDLHAVMRAKLGVELPPQVVLGVCRRPFDTTALATEPSVGLLLPLHVVVRAARPEETVVEAADPVMMVAITGDPALEPIALDYAARLAAALHSLGQHVPYPPPLQG